MTVDEAYECLGYVWYYGRTGTKDYEKAEEFAVELYLRSKHFLAQRIGYHPFFGNLNIMKWLIEDLYKLMEPDPSDADLFDLYYYLDTPVTVSLPRSR